MRARSRRRWVRPGVLSLLLQLLAISIVVAVPWLLNKAQLRQTLAAKDWVVHTADNKTAVNAIRRMVAEVESSLLWLLMDPERIHLRERIDQSYSSADALLGQLMASTAGTGEQQTRVGQLQALLEVHRGESARFLQFLAQDQEQLARDLVESSANRDTLDEIARALVIEEERLLEHHRAQLAGQRQQIEWMSNGVALGQLLLLALIVALSERQQRRRTRAEEISRLARERADRILRTSREPIVVLDGELRVELCNPAFETHYAKEGEAIVGQPLATIGDSAWNDATLLQRLRDVLYLDRELWDFELRQDTLAGGQRIFVVNAWSVPAETGGGQRALILTASDVTARHGAERQIRELNEQLSTRVDEVSEINRELEAFSYSVSHDLRAPLRHISAFAGKLDRVLEPEPGSPAYSHLKVIGDSARRMGTLIDELLRYSRLGRGQLKSSPVAMSTLVQEVRAELSSETAGRSIDWRIGSLPVVSGDTSMLRLVWQNLLANAIKYSADRDPAVIEVDGRYDTERSAVVFRVADNGVGFDMAYADKLFGVFQRLHSDREFAGSGIGLANVRRIVSRHGGQVWAEAELDRGACFFFSLPERPGAGSVEETS